MPQKYFEKHFNDFKCSFQKLLLVWFLSPCFSTRQEKRNSLILSRRRVTIHITLLPLIIQQNRSHTGLLVREPVQKESQREVPLIRVIGPDRQLTRGFQASYVSCQRWLLTISTETHVRVTGTYRGPCEPSATSGNPHTTTQRYALGGFKLRLIHLRWR